MFGKALFRQTVNSAKVATTEQSVPVRNFFKAVAQQQRVANMMMSRVSVRAFSTNTAAIEKSI